MSSSFCFFSYLGVVCRKGYTILEHASHNALREGGLAGSSTHRQLWLIGVRRNTNLFNLFGEFGAPFN